MKIGVGNLLQGFIAIVVGTQMLRQVATGFQSVETIIDEGRLQRLKKEDPEQYLVEAMKPL